MTKIKEILKKVHQIHIRTSKIVNNILAGEYKSVFKGQGIEFEEVRPYVPGDDVRNIDWNVTARTSQPYVKEFVEERELTVMLVVDLSASGDFGSMDKTKNEIACEICALLAFSAIKNNDKVGLIIFTDEVEYFLPPRKGKRHVLRLIREVLAFVPKRKRTNISKGLEYLNKVCKPHSVVFLISDFFDSNFEKSLAITSKKNDLIPIKIIDPREAELPSIGLIYLEDSETNERILIDTFDSNTREIYKERFKRKMEKLDKLFKSLDMFPIYIWSNKSYIEPLIKFFRERERKIAK